jgi:hypothetical protein
VLFMQKMLLVDIQISKLLLSQAIQRQNKEQLCAGATLAFPIARVQFNAK